jgi:N utilization substance protein B
MDLRKQPVDEALRSYCDSLNPEAADPPDLFMAQLVEGAAAQAGFIDRRISELSEHWRIERMPAVDRNILRLAIFEMTGGLTPAPVVIDEALDLARRFSGDDSVAFINGILDAVLRGVPVPAQPEPPPPGPAPEPQPPGPEPEPQPPGPEPEPQPPGPTPEPQPPGPAPEPQPPPEGDLEN